MDISSVNFATVVLKSWTEKSSLYMTTSKTTLWIISHFSGFKRPVSFRELHEIFLKICILEWHILSNVLSTCFGIFWKSKPERVPKISGGRHPQAGERKRLCKIEISSKHFSYHQCLIITTFKSNHFSIKICFLDNWPILDELKHDVEYSLKFNYWMFCVEVCHIKVVPNAPKIF